MTFGCSKVVPEFVRLNKSNRNAVALQKDADRMFQIGFVLKVFKTGCGQSRASSLLPSRLQYVLFFLIWGKITYPSLGVQFQ